MGRERQQSQLWCSASNSVTVRSLLDEKGTLETQPAFVEIIVHGKLTEGKLLQFEF